MRNFSGNQSGVRRFVVLAFSAALMSAPLIAPAAAQESTPTEFVDSIIVRYEPGVPATDVTGNPTASNEIETNRDLEVGQSIGLGYRTIEFNEPDLIDFRMAIENEAAALAAIRATDLDLEHLALHLENCLNHEQNKKDHWLADNSLHIAIVEATGSTRMIKAASTAQYELTIFFQPLFPNYEYHKLHFEEHRKIIQAIKSGDPDAAWDTSNQHLLSEYNYFAQLVAE